MDQRVLKEIGTELKAHRKAAGLTLVELANELKIRKQYLEGIESGNRKKLPSEVYIVGYIKHYARFFNLNERDMLKQLKLAHAPKLASIASNNLITEKEFLPNGQTLIITTIALIVLYVLICLVF